MKASFHLVKIAPAAVGRAAEHLFREMAPRVLFFFTAFAMIFLLFKLFVAQYSIELSAFTTAAAAALILGKVVSLLDWVHSRYSFVRYRPITVIACKTVVYALVVIVLRLTEQLLRLVRKQRSLTLALRSVIADADLNRFLGLLLLITIVVGVYLTIQEIDRAMGKGKLLQLLLERPECKQRCPVSAEASAGVER